MRKRWQWMDHLITLFDVSLENIFAASRKNVAEQRKYLLQRRRLWDINNKGHSNMSLT